MFGLSELAIILIVLIAVLAAKRLPGLARSAGKSARILKAEARAAKAEAQEEERRARPPQSQQPQGEQPGAPRVIRGEAVVKGETVLPDAVADGSRIQQQG
ncbi:Sec-independent protein translocase subunit TatA/TatB [Streptomyces sp. MAR25Y5]|uniref:Sec-independent protein translocase subunit TatA/TatB n=1 Tax=Streptomyces sp. MAR25Y5 TaxID=2962028 RepID=UPI0020B79E70|nr:twin-arginine translocase TatA/TatE family subunit [Streptomyces sp. MAR25Y5]MCP3769596.1 twin-arginine translocase TatA/TatE family subunit [Streptomyces sp. MAR25Y5]